MHKPAFSVKPVLLPTIFFVLKLILLLYLLRVLSISKPLDKVYLLVVYIFLKVWLDKEYTSNFNISFAVL